MKKMRGTEFKINLSDSMGVVIGSVDKNNPKTIYIKFSGWANTIDFSEDIDYKIIISKLSKEIKRYLYFNIDDNLFRKDITMVDMDMRESGITKNKSSFMSCEITLYQVNNYDLNNEIILNEIHKLVKHICENIYDDYPYFKFFNNKKQAKKKLQEV